MKKQEKVENIQFDVDDDEKEIKPKRKKAVGKPNILLILIAVAVCLTTIFLSYKLYSLVSGYTFLPEKYINYILYGLIGVNLFFLIIAILPRVSNLNKILSSILCGILCYALIQANIIVPTYKGQLERTFTEVPSEGELSINAYTLREYNYSNLKDISSKKIGIQTDVDVSYQDYALKVIQKELEGTEVETVTYENIYDLVEGLMSKEVDAILMNESYAEIVSDNDDFLNFEKDTNVLYSCIQPITLEYDTNAVGSITTEPFAILVGGNDNWNYNNMNKTSRAGRTDVNMVVVVNPNTKQILLVTIPRDTYCALEGNPNKMDKLTHATVYDVKTWTKSVEALLDVEINYFVRISFLSLINIVDVLGGITIENPYYFESDYFYDPYAENPEYGHTVFQAGEITLKGTEALCYVRERHYLRNGIAIGDGARTKHQSIVIKAIIDKVTSVAVISRFSELLEAVTGTFNTDLSIDQIYALVQMQLNDMASWDMQSYHLTGKGGTYPSYAMGGRNLYGLVLLPEKLEKAMNYIDQVYEGKVINTTETETEGE